MKFQTGLPPIQLDPVLLEYPLDCIQKYIPYKTTSLEKNHKYELLTEPNMGININLINPYVYTKSSAKLAEKDEVLLKPVEHGKSEQSAEQAAKPSWLKTPIYVDMVNYRSTRAATRAEANESDEEHVTIKKRTISRKAEENVRFDKSKQLDLKFSNDQLFKTLPSGKKVKAVACYPLLPDFNVLANNYMAVNFGSENQTLLGKRGRKHYAELTCKDGSDSLLLVQPTEEIIDAEKTNEDRLAELAQYSVPVSVNTQNVDKLLDTDASIANTVELIREYNGTIFVKNSCSINQMADNQKRYEKLPNQALVKDKTSQAETEPCIALKFDDEKQICYYTYIKEGVNFKVLPKKKKRRVFTKVKLVGGMDENVEFEDLNSILARDDEFERPKKQSKISADDDEEEERTMRVTEDDDNNDELPGSPVLRSNKTVGDDDEEEEVNEDSE